MELTMTFAIQFALSVAVVAMLARWYVAPWLENKPLYFALGVLIAPHMFRHIGLSFLVPGLTGESLPAYFANAAAYGDFISGLLAIAVLFALRYRWAFVIPLIWVFNVVGTADLFYALSHASVISELGVAWFIPTFIVPMLLVTHFMVFVRLIRQARSRSTRPSVDSVSRIEYV